jgi:hypothetical protein
MSLNAYMYVLVTQMCSESVTADLWKRLNDLQNERESNIFIYYIYRHTHRPHPIL